MMMALSRKIGERVFDLPERYVTVRVKAL